MFKFKRLFTYERIKELGIENRICNQISRDGNQWARGAFQGRELSVHTLQLEYKIWGLGFSEPRKF